MLHFPFIHNSSSLKSCLHTRCFYFLTSPSIAQPTMIWLSSTIKPLRNCYQGHQPRLWTLFSFYSTSVVGRTMPPSKDVHSLISRTCDYVTLHSKETLQVVFKVKGTETGRLPELFRWAQSNPRSPKKLEEGDRRVKILFISKDDPLHPVVQIGHL